MTLGVCVTHEFIYCSCWSFGKILTLTPFINVLQNHTEGASLYLPLRLNFFPAVAGALRVPRVTWSGQSDGTTSS